MKLTIKKQLRLDEDGYDELWDIIHLDGIDIVVEEPSGYSIPIFIFLNLCGEEYKTEEEYDSDYCELCGYWSSTTTKIYIDDIKLEIYEDNHLAGEIGYDWEFVVEMLKEHYNIDLEIEYIWEE